MIMQPSLPRPRHRRQRLSTWLLAATAALMAAALLAHLVILQGLRDLP